MLFFLLRNICITLSLLLVPFNALSLAASQKPPVIIENPSINFLRQQKKVHYMKQGIKTHKKIIQKTTAKNRDLITELEEINMQLKGFQKKRNELSNTIGTQEKTITEKQHELENIITEKEELREQIKSRLAAYYRMGDVGVLNVIFSNATLGDFLTFNEYFHNVTLHDQKLIVEYREKIIKTTITHNTLKREKKQLLSTEKQIVQQEANLLETRNSRRKLLSEIRTEKTLYLMALKEIEGAADQLTVTIEQLKKEAEDRREKEEDERESAEIVELTKTGKKAVKKAKKSGKRPKPSIPKKRKPTDKKSFYAQKGLLDPPAKGKVVTFFGKNTRAKFGVTTYENGIDIKIASGTKIKAIHKGTVVYAGFLRGYGKLMIIDHGDQYYSLISRVAELFKKKNETVKKGEVIAVMSDESGLLNDGLHFELRHESQPINPLQWLNKAKLIIEPKNKKS